MSQKTLIIGVVIFTVLVVVGAYFLVAGGGKPAGTIVSYRTADKEKPKVEVKTTFSDMGNVKVSDEKEAVFTIKNMGAKPLQLFNVSSNCGCTTGQIVIDGKASVEFGMHGAGGLAGEIAPGKEGKVRMVYRPYVMPVYGPVDREVYVSTNDPENPKLVFKIRAYVK
jgi:hypothetical protein